MKEKNMKIGKMEFRDYAAKKPLGISPTGEFITARGIIAAPSLGAGSMHALSNAEKVKLTLERYRLEPDFRLGIFGGGVVTKAELMQHVESQTDFGHQVVNVEMDYCNELIAALGSAQLTDWPKIPKAKILPGPPWHPVKKCILLKVHSVALFCENTTDAVTAPFANYRIAHVHPAFAARGFTVTVLSDHNDVRTQFVPVAKGPNTVYIGGIGHGAYDVYTGDAFNRILQVGMYDPAEVSGKAIHFLSCETAGKLGPDTVAKGTKSYAGYDENFTFVWDDPATTTVNEVLLFQQADSTFDIVMANGGTAQQAYDATVQAFNAGMSQVPNTAAASWLKYDRDHLKLLGAPATTVPPYRYVRFCYPLDRAAEAALAHAGEMVDV
jgi:hypothetical protein